MAADYLNSKNIDEAVTVMREMKPPKHFLSEMMSKIVVHSLDRSDEDKEHTSTLIHALCTEGLVTGENLLQVSSLTIVKITMQKMSMQCRMMLVTCIGGWGAGMLRRSVFLLSLKSAIFLPQKVSLINRLF